MSTYSEHHISPALTHARQWRWKQQDDALHPRASQQALAYSRKQRQLRRQYKEGITTLCILLTLSIGIGIGLAF